MNNPYYFSQRYKPQYEINLDQYHLNHIFSRITIKSKFNFPVELYDLNNIFKEMFTLYARLINQFKFKHQIVFSAIFDKESRKEVKKFFSLKLTEDYQGVTLRNMIWKGS